MACPVRQDRLFCQLGPEALAELSRISQRVAYPKGVRVFTQGQAPGGAFVLCSGRAKLTSTSTEGRSIIVRIAEAGEVIGLNATVTGHEYEVSAETIEPCDINVLPRTAFLAFMQAHPPLIERVSEHLATELRLAHQHVVRLGLAPSVRARLAGLLLDWASQPGTGNQRPESFILPLTHEELGELLGSSRETITRLLAEFRRMHLISVRGPLVTVLDRDALRAHLTTA